ncbi:MAG: alkane 1-monooxygenase [Henriciella sp.]|jgi:luciferase family oxidoreductase group 1|uniref:LLM class flavin-dependent oxidoreductase n=1 Tax=Henriciella sp. TaxID=1968823 RepID=UPI000C0D2E7F|nr:LLM class flavin-dependent oxidoreductase [Henriciella sp.]MAN74606.1 alkane 1-monooxygenase [Henriciella sp.]MBF32718.1 alkane 1-monooxygenase [Hyphomonadaceae bacterium]MBK74113.1 alkane 1-monooxygenase [Henriciella sp.]PHR76950.1 MAG: alkane 1-monooxygenase [Henriciella sp.]|tara:strand:- start:12 stop:1022 length:1011 start_codon:yes stop_codon:yes gene_type:complete
MIPFSVLDLAPIVEGSNPQDALARSKRLATHADRLGYKRYWLAEHHNMPGIASAATAVMIAHAGQDTENIRLGAGGIMLPNHAPIMVAEQFGTLEAMYPGRIDLGLGRAPGGDQLVSQALRRTMVGGEDRFPREVMELQAFLGPVQPGQRVQAVPGGNTNIPLWILGSSTFGAQLAAHLGLPYAFASHFAPQQMMQAISIYRETFQPSEQLKEPYVMLGFNMIAAETDEEADRLASSLRRTFVNMRRGKPTQLAAPDPSFDEQIQPHERAMLDTMLSCSAVGSPQTVSKKLDSFIAETGADELILSAHIFDEKARMRSYEIAAEVRESLGAAKAAE